MAESRKQFRQEDEWLNGRYDFASLNQARDQIEYRVRKRIMSAFLVAGILGGWIVGKIIVLALS